MVRVALASLLFSSACVVRFSVDDDARISCTASDECPSNWSCIAALGECRKNGATVELPALTVWFMLPTEGATNVSVSERLVVAFSAGVARESLVGRVRLRSAAGVRPLHGEATELDNTFSFDPGALAPLTEHTLEIDAGVEPLTTASLPLIDGVTRSFVTGLAPDVVAPQPVRDILIDWREPRRAVLTWTNPPDADFAGVLILRRAGARVDMAPTSRASYAIGTRIGEAVVIASTAEATWIDITRSDSPHDYAFFAFDRENNYAPMVRAPFVTAETLTWCPTEAGTFALGSEDEGAAALALDTGAVTKAIALGDTLSFAVSDTFVRDHRYLVRARATNATGTSVGLARELWISPKTLALAPVLDVGAPANAAIHFPTNGWTEFSVEHAGTSFTWSAPPPILVPITTIGEHRVRVRPLRAGCDAGEPTETNTFLAGRAVYVSPLGDDANDGAAATHPVRTISRGIALSTPGTVVYVAEGRYEEQVVLAPNVSVKGGFDATFTTNDPAAHPSRIEPTYPAQSTLRNGADYYAVGAFDARIDEATVFEGFVVAPAGTPPTSSQAIYADGAAPTIRRNTVVAGGSSSSCLSSAICAAMSNGARIDENVIDTGDHGSKRAGVLLYQATASGERNTITGVVGVRLMNGAGVVKDNVIVFAPDNTNTGERTGIDVSPSIGALTISGNTIGSSAPASRPTIGVNIEVGGIRIERNRIHGGAGTPAFGVILANANGLVLASNTIQAGASSAPVGAICLNGTANVLNNTLAVGANGTALRSVNCRLTVANNLLYGDNAWLAYQQDGVHPFAFESNAFLNEGATGHAEVIAGDPANPTAPSSFAASMARFATNGVPAAGNAELFISRAAASTDATVRSGGRELPEVTHDLDGAPRTVPYSIGAFELD